MCSSMHTSNQKSRNEKVHVVQIMVATFLYLNTIDYGHTMVKVILMISLTCIQHSFHTDTERSQVHFHQLKGLKTSLLNIYNGFIKKGQMVNIYN